MARKYPSGVGQMFSLARTATTWTGKRTARGRLSLRRAVLSGYDLLLMPALRQGISAISYCTVRVRVWVCVVAPVAVPETVMV
jgi:hypothetical protein